MKKLFLMAVILTFSFLLTGQVQGLAFQNIPNDIEESEINRIYIEILFGDIDMEYLRNQELSDGSTIGDHDYVIRRSITPRQDQVAARGLNQNFYSAIHMTWNNHRLIRFHPRNVIRNGTRANALRVWDNYVVRFFNGTVNWPHPRVMREQYICHYDFARNQRYWHLEINRNSLGIVHTILSGCNPGSPGGSRCSR